jgi:hypothetical protein
MTTKRGTCLARACQLALKPGLVSSCGQAPAFRRGVTDREDGEDREEHEDTP